MFLDDCKSLLPPLEGRENLKQSLDTARKLKGFSWSLEYSQIVPWE